MEGYEEAVHEAVKGGTWIFLSNGVITLSGFLFWLIITRVVGVWSIGVASAIVSASTIAATLTSAGLSIAVIREIAAKGFKAFIPSVALASLMGFLAVAVIIPLCHMLKLQELTLVAIALTVAMSVNISLQFSLIGFEMFKEYFISAFLGSIAKLAIGVALGFLGFKALAPLLGYLAYPLVASFTALALLLSSLASKMFKFSFENLKSLIKLSLANYPFMFSNRLLTMLSVFLFAYLVGEAFQTGTLYITLMITLAITGIPNALLSAALPIGTRRNTDPFSESFRIGLALATLAIVAIMSASVTVLKTINPELIQGANALKILLLSIAPLTALTTTIMKLNKEGKPGKIALIGLVRLLTLMVLLPFLARNLGVEGAAISFLFSSLILAPLALKKNPAIAKPLTILWSVHAISAILPHMLALNEAAATIVALTIASAIMHLTKTFTANDFYNIFKTIFTTLTK